MLGRPGGVGFDRKFGLDGRGLNRPREWTSLTRGPKHPEWKEILGETNPEESRLRATECQVETARRREVTETPQPPMRPLQIMGVPKMISPPSTELRSWWRRRVVRWKGGGGGEGEQWVPAHQSSGGCR